MLDFDYLVFFLRDILVSYFKNVEDQVGQVWWFCCDEEPLVRVAGIKRAVPSLSCKVTMILIFNGQR